MEVGDLVKINEGIFHAGIPEHCVGVIIEKGPEVDVNSLGASKQHQWRRYGCGSGKVIFRQPKGIESQRFCDLALFGEFLGEPLGSKLPGCNGNFHD